MAENGRYYQIEGKKATAENIDHVLSDLTEMLVDGPEDPKKVAVIYEEVQDPEDRPHFRFGEAGSEIPGDDNQIVVADGEGNAKANVAKFHIENEIESYSGLSSAITSQLKYGFISFTQSKDVTEALAELGLEAADYLTYNSNGTIVLNEEKLTKAFKDRAQDQESPYTKTIAKIIAKNNPYVAFGSDVEVGNQIYWRTEKKKATLSLEGAPQLIMKTRAGSPIISALGTAVLEMTGDNTETFGFQGEYSRKTSSGKVDGPSLSYYGAIVYHSYNSPFKDGKTMSEDDTYYPYIHFGNSSTLIMEGASLIKTAHGAAMELSGNATFRVCGGFPAGYGAKSPVDYQTSISFEPGSYVKLSSEDATYGPGIVMEYQRERNSQIILSNQFKHNGDGSDSNFCNSIDSFIRAYNTDYWRILGLSSEKIMSEALRYRVSIGSSRSSLAERLSNIISSTFVVQGKTNIVIGDAQGGAMGFRLGCSDGYIACDWTNHGETDIKIGTGRSSYITIDVGDGDNATGYYKICPHKDSTTAILFEPHSKTSINFAPAGDTYLKPSGDDTSLGYCGIDFTPYKTELDCRWYKLNADFQGQDAFINTSGNFHVENHGGFFILRGAEISNQIYPGDTNRNETHLSRIWTKLAQNTVPLNPTVQVYDGSNFAMYGDQTAAAPTDRWNTYIPKTKMPNKPTQTDFENSDYYNQFLNTFTSTSLVSYTYQCSENTSKTGWNIVCLYIYTYTEYISELPPAGDAPVFEMRSASELRVRDGAYIKAQTIAGVTTITFGSNRSHEADVSFTLADLQALYDLIHPQV